MDPQARLHLGFLVEQSLGHAAHADNLKQLLPRHGEVVADLVEIPWDTSGLVAKIPVFNSNWTVRSGLRARRAIRSMGRQRRVDALFIHTQVPAILASSAMKRIPTVVSVDATPLQYDELGNEYGHQRGGRRVERLKWHANRRCFDRAARIVTWSAWAQRGLVDGYGVDPGKIVVIPPGVIVSAWAPPARRAAQSGSVRILFVGGDLARKGGALLLEALRELQRELRSGTGAVDVELHLVTSAEVPPATGVTVHRGLTPNAPALVQLYREADVFCLPTRADTHALVLSEAGAAGLPVVSTAVAGIPEIVRHGETGFLVPPDDLDALVRALGKLVEDPELRARFGAAGRELVERELNAERNTQRLVNLLTEVADARRESR
jgi:glycosyltransferase involved in cell wall biosynthesis